MPKTFVRRVQVGKSHAANVLDAGDYKISQSGLIDTEIHCEDCDHHIGEFERYAASALDQLRRTAADAPIGYCRQDNFDSERFLRFCASLLWKYSITKEVKTLKLGPYQSLVREIAFNNAPIPERFDARIFRLILSPNNEQDPSSDHDFAYRSPSRDRQDGVNCYRFMAGGCVIFVRLDKQTPTSSEPVNCWIRCDTNINFMVAPAPTFEEFRKARQLIAKNPKLSKYLEKHTD
jgi:hypothetical protein